MILLLLRLAFCGKYIKIYKSKIIIDFAVVTNKSLYYYYKSLHLNPLKIRKHCVNNL